MRFAKDPAELERKIINSGSVHENTLIMREALGEHFKMSELQSLSLLDLCRLYCDLDGLPQPRRWGA